MSALDDARAAMNRATEARIEIARLDRERAAQEKIVNIEMAKIDAYLAVVSSLGVGDQS